KEQCAHVTSTGEVQGSPRSGGQTTTGRSRNPPTIVGVIAGDSPTTRYADTQMHRLPAPRNKPPRNSPHPPQRSAPGRWPAARLTYFQSSQVGERGSSCRWCARKRGTEVLSVQSAEHQCFGFEASRRSDFWDTQPEYGRARDIPHGRKAYCQHIRLRP